MKNFRQICVSVGVQAGNKGDIQRSSQRSGRGCGPQPARGGKGGGAGEGEAM